MKIRLAPELLPPSLEWRWMRACNFLGLLFIFGAVVARITGRVPEAPMAYTSTGLMFFALGYWMRAKHLATQLQAALARAEKLERLASIGMATAGFAHEMKNTVMVTQGFAELARKTAEEGRTEQLASQLETLDLQSRRMLADLQSFLSLSRGETSTPRSMPLMEALNQISHLLQPLGRQKEIATEVVVEPELTREVSDPEFRQAILNLGLNAIEHAKSHVRVSAVRTGKAIRIDVENDGHAIAPADVERVFEPFVASSRDGSGLGLHQVRTAAEREGGTVTCAPLPEGGTRFTVELPLEAVHVAVPVPQSA